MTFGATTGHTLNDAWTFNARPPTVFIAGTVYSGIQVGPHFTFLDSPTAARYVPLQQPPSGQDNLTSMRIFGAEYDGNVTVTTGCPLIGLHITSNLVDSGSVPDGYGLLIDDQTAASTNNWAIKTGLGKVEFGDTFKVQNNGQTLSFGDSAVGFQLSDALGSGLGWGVVSPAGLGVVTEAALTGASVARAIQTQADAPGTGTTSFLDGVYSYVTNSGTGTVTEASAFYADSGNNFGGGSVTNNYGLFIADQDTATTHATNSWAIKTGLGLVELGGPLEVHGNLGFFATTPTTKKTVAGAKLPADAVMASLLTALVAYGLITDSTT